MFRGGTSPICFTTTILAITVILMITMIKDCDGSMTACNGSTAAECQLVYVEEEEEFMMDTEEHRRILGATNGPGIGYGSLQPGSPACGKNCGGKRYDVAGRKPKIYDGSNRG